MDSVPGDGSKPLDVPGDGSVSDVNENQNVIKTTVFGDIEPSPVFSGTTNVGLVPSYYWDVTPQFHTVMNKIRLMSNKIIGAVQNVG